MLGQQGLEVGPGHAQQHGVALGLAVVGARLAVEQPGHNRLGPVGIGPVPETAVPEVEDFAIDEAALEVVITSIIGFIAALVAAFVPTVVVVVV